MRSEISELNTNSGITLEGSLGVIGPRMLFAIRLMAFVSPEPQIGVLQGARSSKGLQINFEISTQGLFTSP